MHSHFRNLLIASSIYLMILLIVSLSGQGLSAIAAYGGFLAIVVTDVYFYYAIRRHLH